MFKMVSFLLCACCSPSFSSSCFLPTPLGNTNCKNNHRTTLNTTLYITLQEPALHNTPAQPLHNPAEGGGFCLLPVCASNAGSAGARACALIRRPPLAVRRTCLRLDLERFVSFSCGFPELSGSIPGKAEKTCELQRQVQNEHRI